MASCRASVVAAILFKKVIRLRFSTIINIDSFSQRHPLVIFGYYLLALLLLIRMDHPIFFGISFFFLFVQRVLVVGIRKSVRSFLYSISAICFCVLINPLLNHRGVTLLFMLGNMRITKEAVCYGFHMALLLLVSIYLFTCFSYEMTAEKIMVLTGRRFPSFSLLFSMILRIVPKVRCDYKEMSALHGNRPKTMSALLGMEMEDSLERSIAMKSKGYGKKKRTSYYRKKFLWQDIVFLFIIAAMGIYVLVWSDVHVRYFPLIAMSPFTIKQYLFAMIYMGIPLLLYAKEECKWFLWKRKITGSIIRSRTNMPSALTNGK